MTIPHGEGNEVSHNGLIQKLAPPRAQLGMCRFRVAFPKWHFPVIHQTRGGAMSGHLQVTMMREPDLVMSVRRMLTTLVASVLVCGVLIPAQAQTVPSKGAAKPSPAKPEAKPAAVVAGGAEPTLIGQFGTWGAYTATPNGKKVCFALAKPASSKTSPPNRPRDPAYAFVSTRPAEKVTNEVSVMIGYTLKPGSESTLEVGGASYAMYTQGDGLWIKNAAEEERMVDAMRKAADATVKGVSAKGTETTDTFSLKGLSQALDKLAQDCKR
jgi:Invasion associated locus B (IalB) protein